MSELLTIGALLDFLPSMSGAVAALVAAFSTLAVGTIATNTTLTVQGTTFFKTVISSSTADTTASIAHGLGAIAAGITPFGGLDPVKVIFQPIGAGVTGFTAQYRAVTVDSTNVNLRKATTSLSGGANQVEMYVELPHSLVR